MSASRVWVLYSNGRVTGRIYDTEVAAKVEAQYQEEQGRPVTVTSKPVRNEEETRGWVESLRRIRANEAPPSGSLRLKDEEADHE